MLQTVGPIGRLGCGAAEGRGKWPTTGTRHRDLRLEKADASSDGTGPCRRHAADNRRVRVCGQNLLDRELTTRTNSSSQLERASSVGRAQGAARPTRAGDAAVSSSPWSAAWAGDGPRLPRVPFRTSEPVPDRDHTKPRRPSGTNADSAPVADMAPGRPLPEVIADRLHAVIDGVYVKGRARPPRRATAAVELTEDCSVPRPG